MALQQRQYTLNSQQFEIYIYIDDEGNPWFKAKEVTQILEYIDTDKAIRKFIDDDCKIEWQAVPPNDIPINWKPTTIFINESGLYQLMLRSNKSEAIAFWRWITSKVLPPIQKTEDRKQLAIKDEQLAEDRKIMEKKDERILALADTLIEMKPRVTVIPTNDELKHSLYVLNNKNSYKFIRTQQRSVQKQLQKYKDEGYEICLQYKIIPNAINILNKCKEYLKAHKIEYSSKHNEITTTYNIIDLIQYIIINKGIK